TIWAYFSTSIINTANGLVEHSELVTKVYFPRLAAPLATAIPGLLDLGLALVLLVPFMAYFDIVPTLALLTLPLWIIALVVAMLGVGLVLATLNVEYRDVRHLVSLGIQLWLFASPVAYPASLVHGNLQYVYFLNPVAGVLEG